MAARTPALVPRPLGGTGLRVTPVCVGGGPLGSMPENFGYDVSAQRGTDTVLRVLDSPINFLDTAAGYSGGESERRIGAALRAAGGLPEGFVLASKVDRDGTSGDFSGTQVRRSAEGSLERLGLDRLQLLYLHDPEHISFEEGVAAGGPLEELVRLKEEGLAEHIGLAGGPVELMSRYLKTGAFEVLITHNRWTLVDRSADALLDEATALGVGVVNGACFGGGILAKGSAASNRYAYSAADERTLERVRQIEDVCAGYDVPLAAAALQFSMRDPRIASTIVGISKPERVDETVQLATYDVPDDLWARVEPLAAPEELWQW